MLPHESRHPLSTWEQAPPTDMGAGTIIISQPLPDHYINPMTMIIHAIRTWQAPSFMHQIITPQEL